MPPNVKGNSAPWLRTPEPRGMLVAPALVHCQQKNRTKTLSEFRFGCEGHERVFDGHHALLTQVLRFQGVPNSHIVSNVLIDYSSIDTIGLAQSESLAMGIIRGPLGNELSCIFLPDGRRVYRRGGMEVGAAS